jgi:hypothetical protein
MYMYSRCSTNGATEVASLAELKSNQGKAKQVSPTEKLATSKLHVHGISALHVAIYNVHVYILTPYI